MRQQLVGQRRERASVGRFDAAGLDAHRTAPRSRAGRPLSDCVRGRNLCAARLTSAVAMIAKRRFVALADQQQVAAVLRTEHGRRRILDRDRLAQPAPAGRRSSFQTSRACSRSASSAIAADSAGTFPSNTICRGFERRLVAVAPVRESASDKPRAARRTSQTTWNGLLPSTHAVGVVVNRLAGTRAAAGRPSFLRSESDARRSRCIARRCAPPSGRACCGPGCTPRRAFASRAARACRTHDLAARAGPAADADS